MGDSLDRELVARHQMHHGGLHQYLHYKDSSSDVSVAESYNGTGVPDVMVTNYSMLEYMLMRPLEHIFWHTTSEWLRECTRTPDDPMRRRLLLVIDEAHMYQGAMGTEFSQLLNRLLAVLKVSRDRLQFIITSASLGSNVDEARDYTAGLLSLNGEESKVRKSQIVIPKAELIEIEDRPGIDDTIDNKCKIALNDAYEELTSANSNDKNRVDIEIDLLSKIFDTDCSELVEERVGTGLNKTAAHQDVCYSLISESPWGNRLARLLLRPEKMDDNSKEQIIDYYHDAGVSEFVHDPIKSFPRRLDLVCLHMFGDRDKDSLRALDVLLDLVASARNATEGRPFLPMRAHILVRGNGISRICSKCGRIVPEGHDYCDHDTDGCGCLTYELHLDRNCGGTFMVLWLDAFGRDSGFEWGEQNDGRLPRRRSVKELTRAHQHRLQNPISDRDRLLGALAKVMPSLEGASHILNCRSGGLRRADQRLDEDEIFVRIANFTENGNYDPENFTARKWETNEGITQFRICPYCGTDYTRRRRTQFSNTQTRGDEYFSKISIEALSIQDPDPDSPHPHQGRKMMIFSDGRQQAARLARQLSEEVTMDEGRTLLLFLLRKEWFKSIPKRKRSLHHIYPYMCALSGAMSVNPLSDSTSRPDRSKMLSHSSSLASWVLIKMSNGDEELNKMYQRFFPTEDQSNLHRRDYAWRRIKRIIRSNIYELRRDLGESETSEDIERLEQLLVVWKEGNQIVTIGRRTFYDGLGILDEYRNQARGTSAHNQIKLFKRTIQRDPEILTCMSLQSSILENETSGHLAISQQVFSRLFELLDNSDSDFCERIADLFSEWMRKILANSLSTVPQSFGASLLRWLFHDLFGTIYLGLTWGQLILDDADIGILSPSVAEKVSKVLPAIMTEFSPMSVGTNGNSTRRILCSTSRPHGTRDVVVLSQKSHRLSYDDPRTISEGIRVSSSDGLEEVKISIIDWIEDYCPDLIDHTEEIEDWLDERSDFFFHQTPDYQDVTQERWNLRSDRYEIVPWEGGISENIELCNRCFAPRCLSVPLNCLHCGNETMVPP